MAGMLIGNIMAGPTAPSEATAETGAAAEEGDENVKGVEEKDGPDRFKVPVTSAQPSRGPADALVTIVQWSDFQCPFCSRVEPTMDQILKDYGNKVRVVWRNNPLPF
ncbi:MAG TPA: thioredoxin domain-containing protein, partial [Polyangiales bacterium]|nr:thioredoxin domain-containing protein [Polyangiales bacterium]